LYKNTSQDCYVTIITLKNGRTFCSHKEHITELALQSQKHVEILKNWKNVEKQKKYQTQGKHQKHERILP